MVDVNILQENPRNPNKHPDRQIELLAKIIGYQGQRSPIVVSKRSGFIVKGHGRLSAIKKLGWDKAAVDYQDYENEAQEFADMVADNKIAELAEHDDSMMIDGIKDLGLEDFELLGLDDFSLPELFEAQADEDEIPEHVEPLAKLGDIYQLGRHRLMCGDSTSIDAVEKLMNGEKAQTFFSDPPYGGDVGGLRTKTASERVEGKTLIKRTASIIGDTKIDWLVDAFANARTFLKDDFTVMIFFKWDHYEEIKKMGECFGKPSACCVWDRVRKASAFFRFQPQHEFCFHWGNQSDKKETSALSNVWREPKELENSYLHPTVKPIAILEPAIRVTTDQNESVLDLFGGSGSTLIACEKTNRKCFMMELDPHYVDVIIARWEKYTGKKAEFLTQPS